LVNLHSQALPAQARPLVRGVNFEIIRNEKITALLKAIMTLLSWLWLRV